MPKLAPHSTGRVKCAAPECLKVVPRLSRQQTYCSKRCRQRSHYWAVRTTAEFSAVADVLAFPSPSSTRPTHPPKLSNNINEQEGEKSGSSIVQNSPLRAAGVTLMGPGVRTPWTGYALDRELVESIYRTELGPLVSLPDVMNRKLFLSASELAITGRNIHGEPRPR